MGSKEEAELAALAARSARVRTASLALAARSAPSSHATAGRRFTRHPSDRREGLPGGYTIVKTIG
jgi:hypothetical protein